MGDWILDAGAGSGRHAVYMASLGCWVVALDISLGMLREARRLVEKNGVGGFVYLVQADLRFLPFRGECFDRYLSVAALHHIPGRGSRVKVMREAARCVRPGGIVVVTVLRLSFKRLLKALLYVLPGRRLLEFGDVLLVWRHRGRKYMRYYHLFTGSELAGLADKAGLQVRRVTVDGPSPRLRSANLVLVCVKP